MLDLLPKKSKLGKALKETDNDNLMVLPAGKGLRKLDVHMDEEDLSFDRLMKALEKKKFDLVVFDCPPQIGVLGEHILDTADRIIVPIVPTPLSTRTYDMIREFADKRKFPKKKIHGYWSMVRSRLKIHKETMENYGKKHKEIFQTFLPVSADIERMSENKKPLLEMRYSLPARQKMQALMDEMYQAGILK
jgi:chromosome partitioning protein